MDTLVFASLMGLYYWFARLRLGYTFSAMLLQPVVIAVFVGLLLGNMETAMIIGAGMQLVYLAACISIPIAVKAGMDPNLAIALAIPFGVIGVFLDQLRRTLNAAWVHMADKHAETANMGGIMRCAFLYPALLGLVLRFPVVFAANYFGQDVVESFLKLMPHWLTHSFEIMGGAGLCHHHYGDRQEEPAAVVYRRILCGAVPEGGHHGDGDLWDLRGLPD